MGFYGIYSLCSMWSAVSVLQSQCQSQLRVACRVPQIKKNCEILKTMTEFVGPPNLKGKIYGTGY